MTKLHKLVSFLQRYPKLFAALILPFYLGRFILASIREKSLWFYRYPPGHYGSTIPSQREIDENQGRIFGGEPTADGVNLNVDLQLNLLRDFATLGGNLRLNEKQQPNNRFYYDNNAFRLSDALILCCILSHFRPKRIIEIGSGFSSALMLDRREAQLNDTRLTFVEPFPGNLKRLMRSSDQRHCEIFEKKIQDVSLEIFDSLQQQDILFVDSSHVLKIGSDVSTILFSIFPRLNPGVVVHVHDIFWPFEYPQDMIKEGRIWNETYLLRSFLQYNSAFEIVYFSSYIENQHPSVLRECLPNYTELTGGSLWLRKL